MAEIQQVEEDYTTPELPCQFIPPYLLQAVAAKEVREALESQEKDSEAGNALPRYISKVVHVPMSGAEAMEIGEKLVQAIPELPKPSSPNSPNRHVFDLQYCHRADAFPGVRMRSEGDQAIEYGQDNTVNQCFDNMGIVCDFFREALKDTSVFCNGVPLIGIVHYHFYYPGAWWHQLPKPTGETPAHVIVFGDGWENDPWNQGESTQDFEGCFGNFSGSLEVVAHEMGHAYVQSVKQLEMRDDPGALNEHIADVIGIMCEQWYKKQTVLQADWLVGEDLIAASWKGVALRSMKEPGSAYKLQNVGIGDDPQVASKEAKLKTDLDAGGVHINSGILNRAFYLAAMAFGGHSWEKAGPIWLETLKQRIVMPGCTFETWASTTVRVAKRKFGTDAEEIVKKAWLDVGYST